MKNKFLFICFVFGLVFITSFFFNKTQKHYIYLSEGKIYLKKKDFERARQSFLKALSFSPADIRTIQYIFFTDQKLNNDLGSNAIYQILLNQTNVDSKIVLYVADHFYSREYFNQAEKLYKNISNREEQYMVEVKLAEVLLWQKKHKEAIVLLQDLYNKNSKNTKVLKHLANAYFWSNQPNMAIPYYETLLREKIMDQEILINYADSLRYTGQNEKAIQIYDQYLNNNETN